MSDVVGVEVWGLYDGIAYWQRQDGYAWHRWPKGSLVRARVEQWARDHGVTIHDTPRPDEQECD